MKKTTKAKTPIQLREELSRFLKREILRFPSTSLASILSYGVSGGHITPAHLVALGQLSAFSSHDAGSSDEIVRSFENAVRTLIHEAKEAA